MIYLNLNELLRLASRTLGGYKARDYGLLNAGLARPQTDGFGYDAYPTIPEKTAALPCSLTVNHALIGGNKRQALAAVLAFCGVNGQRLTLMNAQVYQLVMGVANGELDLRDHRCVAQWRTGVTSSPAPAHCLVAAFQMDAGLL
ncbi:MAG: death on curing protein [Micromonosporaceae bacterium]|nr:death on curing protein [Micromonosporaceae bacterium]